MAKGKYEYWLTDDGLLLLAAWARDGLTDEQIAARCGVQRSTLALWKGKHSDISDALKKNKEIVDYEVENALLNRSKGYHVPEEVAFKCKRVFWDDKGRRCEEEEIKTATIQKYVPPDTTAQLAWLNNRRGDRWRRNSGKEKLDESKFEHEKDIDTKRYW